MKNKKKALNKNEHCSIEKMPEDSQDYNFTLDNFEGPLDLLLHLIKKAELNINDIKLSLVTEQYMNYMVDIKNIDVTKAIRFIDVAATLIEIKSKALLPQHGEDEADDYINEEALLLRNIKEYKIFKDISEKIQDKENVDKFYKAADETVLDQNYVLKDLNIENLMSAFSKILSKIDLKEPEHNNKILYKDRFSVSDSTKLIKNKLNESSTIKFSGLISEDFSKLEVITYFLAILELIKKQEIQFIQDKRFDDFIIKLN